MGMIFSLLVKDMRGGSMFILDLKIIFYQEVAFITQKKKLRKLEVNVQVI